jgi:hypothetical protein
MEFLEHLQYLALRSLGWSLLGASEVDLEAEKG